LLGTERKTHSRTRPGTVPGVGDNNRAPHSHSLCCSRGTGSRAVAYIFKVCCLRFSPPHIYLGWPRPRWLGWAVQRGLGKSDGSHGLKLRARALPSS